MDYDGSQTNFESSMNYTLQEYANDVVYHIQTVCDEAGVQHPTIISESGRAVVGLPQHADLQRARHARASARRQIPTDSAGRLRAAAGRPDRDLSRRDRSATPLETYHDAQQALDMAMNLFSGGYLSLEQRSHAENLFWAICDKIHKLCKGMADVPEELQALEELLSDTYFCNFSLFQSIPDSWAIKQLFPVMPIHRLNERPTNHAVLGDITCDSDGKLDQFIDRRDVKKTILLHTFNGEPYYLGVFLVGAYQEILGDLHNLFGDTHAVHVALGENGDENAEGARVEHIIKGDTVREVLKYVEFDPEMLMGKLRRDVEAAVHAGRMEDQQAGRLLKFYEEALRATPTSKIPNAD